MTGGTAEQAHAQGLQAATLDALVKLFVHDGFGPVHGRFFPGGGWCALVSCVGSTPPDHTHPLWRAYRRLPLPLTANLSMYWCPLALEREVVSMLALAEGNFAVHRFIKAHGRVLW